MTTEPVARRERAEPASEDEPRDVQKHKSSRHGGERARPSSSLTGRQARPKNPVRRMQASREPKPQDNKSRGDELFTIDKRGDPLIVR